MMTGSSSAAESKPKVFDSRYYIYEIVGRGASSVVYRAKHVLNDKRELALKVLLPQNGKEFNSDLLRHESLALITARHNYVIRLEDFRSVDSICYLAMEYASLHNLAKYYGENKANILPVQLERYLTQITEALSFMHNIGMCHRDIKPDNILLINDRQARLSDLGMTTLPGQKTSVEELKNGIGTFDYMPPEVLKGKDFDPRADIYSLGLSFYELFSGSHPFKNLSLGQSLIARETQNIVPLKSLLPDIPEYICLLYTSPSPRDQRGSRMPSSA